MIKKTLLRILTVVIIAIFSFIALELLFRLYRGKDLTLGLTRGKDIKKYSHGFEPNKGFKLESSKKGEFDVCVDINNYGFRGKDIVIDKTEGIKRIFMVGDSFTFGVGAEEDETIPYLFEENLKKQGMEVEVINAGVGHSSPMIYYLKLRDIYMKFKPDFVVLLLDFSDLRDDWRNKRQAVYDSNGRLLSFDPNLINGKRDWWRIIRRNSEVCKYIHNKIVRTAQKIQVLGLKTYIKAKFEGKRAKAVIATSKDVDSKIDSIEYDGYLLMRGREKKNSILKHWKITEEYLVKIRDLLYAEGIGFALTMYPYGIHVSPDEWNEGRVYWGFDKDRLYTDRYAFDLIEETCRKNNIYCINTLEDFLKVKSQKLEEKLFFDLDGHMTPSGNSIVAKGMSDDRTLIKMIENTVIRR